MLIDNVRESSSKSSEYDMEARLDTVAELLKTFDGNPVSKSLIRRAVLRSILHLPPNHTASEALDLFYEALDTATVANGGRKTRNKVSSVASLTKIWAEARKAIETVTAKLLNGSAQATKR